MRRSEMGADDLRDVFQDLPRETAPDEPCPTPEELWASARGELAAEENRRVIDHTGRCPSCAEAWRVARYVGRRVSGDADEVKDRTRREKPAFRWLPAAAAAAIVVLAGVGLFIARQAKKEPTYRVENRPAIESLVPEDQALSRANPTLRWSGPEGASYSVVVTTGRLEVLAQAEGLTESEYRLPASVVSELTPGTVLLWHVEALLPDGARVPSKTFRVRIE